MSCANGCPIAARHRANRHGKGARAILKGVGKALNLSAATASVISMAVSFTTTYKVTPAQVITSP